MADREKVIKEYENYVNSYISLTTNHDYEFEMHKAVLALLKEQDNCENCAIAIEDRQFVVRCKDCIWFHKPDAKTKKSCKCNYHGCATEEDKYCWWGEKDD